MRMRWVEAGGSGETSGAAGGSEGSSRPEGSEDVLERASRGPEAVVVTERSLVLRAALVTALGFVFAAAIYFELGRDIDRALARG